MRLKPARFLRRLLRSETGVSMIEFALIVPVITLTITAGTELAHFASVQMQVSQIAIAVADNGSRLGQEDNSAIAPSVTEEQVDAIMFGAMQEGSEIDLAANGRVILSSLEWRVGKRRSQIHWQRCQGALPEKSAYGGAGSIGPVGAEGNEVNAIKGYGVMVAEVYYHYQPIFAHSIVDDVTIRREALFLVRDRRAYGKWNTDGIAGDSSESKCT